jgi:hypothetical protein
MIHYQLRCSQAHEFDGWFKDSIAFEQQAQRGLVDCPTCGDTRVERALMTPAVATRERPRPEQAAATPEPTPQPETAPAPMAAAGRLPAHVMAMLQRMRTEVEKNCDYVGPSFADEARKIHYGESDKRGIYGETTPQEAQALEDEGIDVSRIPWVPRADG